MMSSELVLQNVDKIYGSGAVHAVKDLSFTVKPGEITALLGSSGCGKTSTLRMIAGFETLTRGSIALDNRPIHMLAPAQRGVAMAFETYSLYPPLTLAENISFALKAQKLGSAEVNKRVKAMAEMLEIGDVLHKYPSSVSGGQQQRASLGRALVRSAGLYLLDEPMGQLEPQLRAVLRGRIKHYLREHKCTTILVTHDQTEANALADRIAVMEGGVLQQYATPAELKTRPVNLFVGSFIGEPPMNVLPVRVKDNGQTIELVLEGGEGQTLSYAARDFPDAVRQRLKNDEGLMLGVRPHAVHIGESGLTARVVTCQWLGDQTHIAAEIAGRTVVSVSHEKIAAVPGSTLRLRITPNDLHMFSAGSGEAIAHGAELA
ncbi:ABC transporter ATP-binding protein [Nordella sp. HKS 07]|uniref:ABC transporter ATP-binding protein n=1 Tax=Nordella sp. HKS 07 TaxID=2712222 RepID=UPI0013E1AAB4|nr:ABC transporter ATP-binding protein [Nordella sp. HKS 07]QIG52383.1 ABC transporter ATP-binding protein [Nordella sp. HKS 07]